MPAGQNTSAAMAHANSRRGHYYRHAPRYGYASRYYYVRPGTTYVYTYRPIVVRPYHGVFVYGPAPVHHHYYGTPTSRISQAHMPTRAVDRSNTLAVGIRGGSYYGDYTVANGFADAGLGFTARYRPEEALGLELAMTRYDQTFAEGSERRQTTTQASAMLFAMPWTRFSPYALAGVTVNSRNIADAYNDRREGGVGMLETRDRLWGPHGGLGVEFAIGQRVALDLEARYVGYLNRDKSDPTVPAALQTTAGILMHF